MAAAPKAAAAPIKARRSLSAVSAVWAAGCALGANAAAELSCYDIIYWMEV